MSNFQKYRIGVDVGGKIYICSQCTLILDLFGTQRLIYLSGTNTDAVLLALSTTTIVASQKTPTTSDVTTGITIAIKAVIDQANVALKDINCVIIGTTHFVNAVIERSHHLRKVAVVRLSGGGAFGKTCPPFVDFPIDLRERIMAKSYFCQGGYQIDGSEITAVDKDEIIRVAAELALSKNMDIVVAGIYSPINPSQEEHVAKLLEEGLEHAVSGTAKGCDHRRSTGRKFRITLSHTVSSIGFLARENTAILNASLRPIAEHTIRGFRKAMNSIFQGSHCPLYLTQNDGSVMSAAEASRLPINTLNSGPTNSIMGGAFLWKIASNANGADSDKPRESLVVLDIGGTTADAGMLLPNGMPRMSSVSSYIAGVKTNFGLPAVESVGLGGGSIVNELADGSVIVGPDSVGFEIQKKALIFGGSIITATDISMASFERRKSTANPMPLVGNPSLVASLNPKLAQQGTERIKEILELLVDRTKVERGDVDVLVVGGGSIIVDTTTPMMGVKSCKTVAGGDVANAVGAAISKVQGLADMVVDISTTTIAEAAEKVKRAAIQKAAENGADIASVSIAEITMLPIQYVQAKARIIAKAIGELDTVAELSKTSADIYSDEDEIDVDMQRSPKIIKEKETAPGSTSVCPIPIASERYRPYVKDHEWILSILDVDFISIGCKILGCGGGGEPYFEFLATKSRLEESPGSIRVIDPRRLKDSDIVGWSSNMGSPEVSSERMDGNECYLAQIELMKFMGYSKMDAMIALEIGGGNGLVNLGIGARLNIPIVDADYMGRAYPTYWQTTANVYDLSGRAESLVPVAIASGDGSIILMPASKSDKLIDRTLRAACVEMGSRAGKAAKPQLGSAVRTQAVPNTVSLAWRIGRAARLEKNISRITDRIIEECGGFGSAKRIFEGKIVSVERTLKAGHTYGIVETEGLFPDGTRGFCRIPFKNENILVETRSVGSEWDTVVSVPDLIAVLDVETGHGLGVPEYRYGLKVVVVAMSAPPQWTDSPRGLELGGPASMGFDGIDYKPVGSYVRPYSVIEEFGHLD
jgi:DUF917 family protein/N-methylhydantoinase A/oxoprolinase/acetone carboxylase beta subunit